MYEELKTNYIDVNNKLPKDSVTAVVAVPLKQDVDLTDNVNWAVSSPSGNVQFKLSMGANNQLFYSVYLVDAAGRSEVIRTSPLGLTRDDGNFTTNLTLIGSSKIMTLNENFSLSVGKQTNITSISNELTITFQNEKGDKMQIIARVFDDGAAFRYRFPNKDKTKHSVLNEVTGFAVNPSSKAWIQPYDKVTEYSPGYERYFESAMPAGTPSPGPEGWCFPALFECSKAWVLITEAAVDSNFYAAHLQPNSYNSVYSIRMPEENEAMNVATNIPSSSLPWEMPWRVVIVGRDLSTVVESSIVPKLNPASKLKDTSWIKPGRSSWSWWSYSVSTKSFKSLSSFIDFSSEMGWEYTLVDANWDLMVGGNIIELVKYADSKNVGILMWYNSGGAHNTVSERPRNIINNRPLRQEEFKKLASWGVKGIKVDFFHSDKPYIMNEYITILEDAAANKLLVNFHGCTLPRGWNRTWPNLISTEAVKGAENYIFDNSYPLEAPKNNATFPFTRNVVGSMDYTPVTFSDNRYPHLTSYGHELALSILFESGIVHFADRVSAYQDLPIEPRTFLKNVPTTWERSLLLDGYPAKFCVMARLSKGKWYISGINGTFEKMTINLDLTRLHGDFKSIDIIADGKTNKEFSSYSEPLSHGQNIKIELLPAGGFVAIPK